MTEKRGKREYVATAIRLPPDVHAAVHEAAKQQERSFNGQIVATLRSAHIIAAEQPRKQGTS